MPVGFYTRVVTNQNENEDLHVGGHGHGGYVN